MPYIYINVYPVINTIAFPDSIILGYNGIIVFVYCLST